jgi:hypothetical protein
MAIRKTPLRVPAEDLSNSRKAFIQQLENKRQFEEDCAIIIPELERLWKEKILEPFRIPEIHGDDGDGELGTGTMIVWKHYLYNYSPILLSKTITRLASRLVSEEVKMAVNRTPPPIHNLGAYFKALVQEMRRKELKRQDYRAKMRDKLAEKKGQVECEACWGEFNSRACLRPAHLRARAGLPENFLDPFNDPRWEGCICLQDEHHRDCPAIKTGKCHYQSYYGIASRETTVDKG